MASGMSLDHPWAFAFGILGNLISFMVYFSPLPTFYRVYKKKSTEGFQSVPYVVALFSAMLWIYYAFIKTNTYLLITINAFGCVIETIYIAIYLIYAPRKAKMYTFKMIMLLNVGLFSSIVLCTLLLFKGSIRLQVLGWICVAFSVCVFAAPLAIIRLVIRTKSVEFMPFSLSFFLTLSAVVWFSFGVFSKDIYVALPNVLGFSFGAVQMALYIFYKDTKVPQSLTDKEKLPEYISNEGEIGNQKVMKVVDGGHDYLKEDKEMSLV
ncbi:bidirectional sugar transporter SWEET14-like [Phalaenopsis equestris]|uniref:bidirectional sugar transporter SWEET14-like n=1 Tax=Phalaenopsis equestris TaxID=78828 RepID=UPI0009E3A85D|nr:bidirectional sugar transporter SWEET14-like [Phalaenopsis equestris]